MKNYMEILSFNITDFFRFIKTIKYGYQDIRGQLHYENDPDFLSYDYVFSPAEEVVKNNCGWCWDVANLIINYCKANQITYKSYFLEYNSNELHQTHTQVIVCIDGEWYAALDNSSDIEFGKMKYPSADKCIADFLDSFVAYLKWKLNNRYDESFLLIKEFSCVINDKISDEEYLNMMRNM